MLRLVLLVALITPFSTAAQAGSWDQLRQLASIHAKAKQFDRCTSVCGKTGGNARACCICFGGDWFGSIKGGHCG